MPTDLSPPSSPLSRASVCGLVAVMAFWLAACSTAPAAPSTAEPEAPVVPQPPPVVRPSTAPMVTPVQTAPSQPPVVLDAQSPAAPDLVAALLSYADRLQALNPTELAAEILVQGDPGTVPLRQMQMALALIHVRQPADTARALGLLQRVIAHTGPESLPFKPLARLVANRLMDQRKLEENADRQAQQLRESQRRIDQLNERLEAMRAIERSLTTRPPASPRSPPP